VVVRLTFDIADRLGPAVMEPGDTIAILYGAPYPFVLKAMEDNFALIGDCYVQGIMGGELFQLNEAGRRRMRGR
jgi:hypothetical protein